MINWFNKYRDKDALVSENEMLRREIYRLKVEALGSQDKSVRSMAVLSAGTGDVAPSDAKLRASYVSSAASFCEEILDKKLMQMIAHVREQLDTVFLDVPSGMDRSEYDNILRGTSNAFRLLLDWSDNMKSEHSANITKLTQ